MPRARAGGGMGGHVTSPLPPSPRPPPLLSKCFPPPRRVNDAAPTPQGRLPKTGSRGSPEAWEPEGRFRGGRPPHFLRLPGGGAISARWTPKSRKRAKIRWWGKPRPVRKVLTSPLMFGCRSCYFPFQLSLVPRTGGATLKSLQQQADRPLPGSPRTGLAPGLPRASLWALRARANPTDRANTHLSLFPYHPHTLLSPLCPFQAFGGLQGTFLAPMVTPNFNNWL